MERVDESGNGEAEKKESLMEKLQGRRSFHKKGTPSTPVRDCFWPPYAHDSIAEQAPPISARKLAASLWESHYYLLPLSTMRGGGGSVNNSNSHAADSTLRLRHRYHHRHDHQHQVKDEGFQLSQFWGNTSPGSLDQPETASSLRKHIVASVMPHHQSIERSNYALQPVSPASYGSSMEVTPYNFAATPTSSLDLQRRRGESRNKLKTSTELLKVLNRIWSLEEQHSSHISLIKSLKNELDHSRSKMRELLENQQTDRHKKHDLLKQISENEVFEKSKEHDRLYSALQSARDELEGEKKLRKRSESVHRKLAGELSEMKSALFDALKNREREKNVRKLLEELCDEFANGIIDYEMELHGLKQKYDKDFGGRNDHDRLILHVSESWLDGRMQKKIDETEHGFAQDYSITEKLCGEIESFLHPKPTSYSQSADEKMRRNSLESVPLNEGGSAPRRAEDEDSEGSDSNCFELNKSNGNDKTQNQDVSEAVNESNSTYVIDNLMKNHLSLTERCEIDKGEASCSYPVRKNTHNSTPVQQQMSKPFVHHTDNSLRRKLVEARLKGRSRLKLFKTSS